MSNTFHSKPTERLYDVRAAVYDLRGEGSDGAYDLIGDRLTPAEIAFKLSDLLSGDWGLTNSEGPFRLRISIGPAGTGDELPD